MQTEASIEIARPINEVFEFTTEHVAEWSLTVVSDELIEEKPGKVGSRFRTVTEERGRRMEFTGEVTRHEPPRLHEVHLRGRSFDILATYRFEEAGEGRTRLTQRAEIRAKGWFRPVMLALGWLMRRSGCEAQQRELENLKRLMESRSPGTQEAR